MSQTISKFTSVNADNTTKEQTEQGESMRHFFVKSVLFIFPGDNSNIVKMHYILIPEN